ncbi:MAG: hypothetical protein H6573_20455 [Lewinellaceae bacterium]|nr:hypothetical protein [Lewinellaceae bacterium]
MNTIWNRKAGTDGYIIGIQEDKQGFLWLVHKNGISRFCPETGKFKNYDSRDGLLNHGFNPNAFISSKSKAAFYAGGKNGLSLFYPDSIRENPFIPAVIISSLKNTTPRRQNPGDEGERHNPPG